MRVIGYATEDEYPELRRGVNSSIRIAQIDEYEWKLLKALEKVPKGAEKMCQYVWSVQSKDQTGKALEDALAGPKSVEP